MKVCAVICRYSHIFPVIVPCSFFSTTELETVPAVGNCHPAAAWVFFLHCPYSPALISCSFCCSRVLPCHPCHWLMWNQLHCSRKSALNLAVISLSVFLFCASSTIFCEFCWNIEHTEVYDLLKARFQAKIKISINIGVENFRGFVN